MAAGVGGYEVNGPAKRAAWSAAFLVGALGAFSPFMMASSAEQTLLSLVLSPFLIFSSMACFGHLSPSLFGVEPRSHKLLASSLLKGAALFFFIGALSRMTPMSANDMFWDTVVGLAVVLGAASFWRAFESSGCGKGGNSRSLPVRYILRSVSLVSAVTLSLFSWSAMINMIDTVPSAALMLLATPLSTLFAFAGGTLVLKATSTLSAIFLRAKTK